MGFVIYVAAKFLDAILWFWTPRLKKPLCSHVCMEVLYPGHNPDSMRLFESLHRIHGMTMKSLALQRLPLVCLDVMRSSKYLMTQL
jgi:hypothetical protein